MKFPFFIFIFSLSLPGLFGQSLPGFYHNNNQYVELNADSTAHFELIFWNDNFGFYEEGIGTWHVKKKFLIIDVLPKFNSIIEPTTEFTDSIRIYDSDSVDLPQANCLFYDSHDSLIGGKVSSYGGWISLDIVKTDSVYLSFVGLSAIGFKPQANKGYNIYLKSGDHVNKGQVILRLKRYHNDWFISKFITYTEEKHKLNKKYLHKLHFDSFFTMSSEEFAKN